jgi:adenylosuccinate lyase
MRAIWNDETLLNTWAAVEAAVLRAQTSESRWPDFYLDALTTTPRPSVDDWKRETERVGHEFVAFLNLWRVPRVHVGLTSSDVIDTALSVRLRRSNRVLVRHTLALRDALADAAWLHRGLPRLGRTHGQPAVETRAGHRLADLAFAVDRCAWRLQAAQDSISVAKISGPVGTYMHVSREVEAAVAAELGLVPAASATQIIMRDSIAAWAADVAVLASVCEALAVEIRLSAHEAVSEFAEPQPANRVGSSAMPHKRNPILSERITGLARIARSAVVPLMEGVAQFHDRDLAHSSVERVHLPLLCGAVDYSTVAATQIASGLRVNLSSLRDAINRAGVQIHTHTAMYYCQLAGMDYATAHRVVGDAYRESSNEAAFWRRIREYAPDAKPGRPDVRQTTIDARRLGSTPKEA